MTKSINKTRSSIVKMNRRTAEQQHDINRFLAQFTQDLRSVMVRNRRRCIKLETYIISCKRLSLLQEILW